MLYSLFERTWRKRDLIKKKKNEKGQLLADRKVKLKFKPSKNIQGKIVGFLFSLYEVLTAGKFFLFSGENSNLF